MISARMNEICAFEFNSLAGGVNSEDHHALHPLACQRSTTGVQGQQINKRKTRHENERTGDYGGE